ncbi:MAG TPA: DUF2550 domain-containing protein [Nocardioidaceae bacterium]|nr:DUF2550 domain-containing protein [Nocardioidaceae bacterium]
MLDVIGLCLLALLLVAVYLVSRRRWLARNGGTFDLSVRVRSERPGRGWVLGVGRYSGDELEWFRIFTLSLRPKRRLNRRLLEVENRRDPVGAEEFALYDDAVVAMCRYAGEPLELALTLSALTGLLAWLEAAPPGHSGHELHA